MNPSLRMRTTDTAHASWFFVRSALLKVYKGGRHAFQHPRPVEVPFLPGEEGDTREVADPLASRHFM